MYANNEAKTVAVSNGVAIKVEGFPRIVDATDLPRPVAFYSLFLRLSTDCLFQILGRFHAVFTTYYY